MVPGALTTKESIPRHLKPIFTRLGITSELWVDCIIHFHKWFRSSVGKLESMQADAKHQGNAVSPLTGPFGLFTR